MDQFPEMTPSLKYITAVYYCSYSEFQKQDFEWNFFISENRTGKSHRVIKMRPP
jgi:hypothetical protein